MVLLTLLFFHVDAAFSQGSFKLKDLEEMIQKGKFDSSKLFVDSTWIQNLGQNLVILRQDYSLYDKKKKKYYGYNGNDEFGTTFSLGIKCNGFTILMDEAVNPWNYDSKYPYFQENRLTPQITKSRFLLLDDSLSFKYTELDSVVIAKQDIKPDMLYVGNSLTTNQRGFIVNTSDTCTVGVLAWIVNKNGTAEKGDLKIEVVTTTFNMPSVGNVAIVPPSNVKDVIGCLYIARSDKSCQPYTLAGVACSRNEQWTLFFPFKDFKYDDSVKKENVPVEKGKLTEIRKK